ncbi:MAG: SHOCT domain-containing protein [Desulfuromonadaceae bacterium]|nr:SHOCT domain-containing protein [Desulfuromonadaceae bacterium]
MRTNLVIFCKTTIPVAVLSGCAHQPMNGSMRGWEHMRSCGFGGIFMWLFMIILVGAIAYFGFYRSKTAGTSVSSTEGSPTEILKKRYVKGEITKEEFDRLKKDIED